MASDTPRTAAATMRYRYSEKRGEWHGSDHFDYVEPESMAELERELSAANARADSAKRDALEEAARVCEAPEGRGDHIYYGLSKNTELALCGKLQQYTRLCGRMRAAAGGCGEVSVAACSH